MAFFRRRRRFGRRRSRRFGRRRGYSKIKRIARREVNKVVELKYYDKTNVSSGVDYSGTIIPITEVPQGDTDGTRV